MYFELREYQMAFTASADYLQSFRTVGRKIMHESGFDIVGAWTTEIGPDTNSTLVWMIRWDSLEHRTRAFEAFRAHPGYPAFIQENTGRVVGILTRILNPVPAAD